MKCVSANCCCAPACAKASSGARRPCNLGAAQPRLFVTAQERHCAVSALLCEMLIASRQALMAASKLSIDAHLHGQAACSRRKPWQLRSWRRALQTFHCVSASALEVVKPAH